jgi:DNA polymerase III sliding clamp (beta) subunit (PCNA family)
MKIAIDQEKFLKALEKGGFAALSDIAQNDNSNMAVLLKSVKIVTTDKNVTIESGNPMFSTKTTIPATKEAGVIVEEEGAVLLKAKELVSWIKAQGKGSTIKLELNKLETPETISVDDEKDETKTFSITQIGTVKVVSKDASKTVGKWELDSFDPDQVDSVDYSDTQKKQKFFKACGTQLDTAINSIKFSAFLQDISRNLENISVQNHNDEVYFATTDTKRCSLFKLDSATGVECKDSLLVSAEILSQVSKILDKDDDVVVSYNDEASKVFLSQSQIEIRISCPDKDTISSYPNITLLLNKKYDSLGTIGAKSFGKMLSTVSLVNNHSALYTFKDNKLNIQALSENSSCKPSVTESPVEDLSEETTVILSVKHFKEFLKQVKSEEITFNISEDQKSLTILGNNEENFTYFVMSIKNSLYQPLLDA